MNPEDLEILVKKQKIFQKLPEYNQCSCIAKILILKIEEIFSKSFVREALLLLGDGYSKNMLIIVTSSHIFTPKKFKIIFDIFEKYLTDTDIEKMIKCQGENILHVLVRQQNEVILMIVWKRVQEYFKSKNEDGKFRELIFQKTPLCRDRTVLHAAAIYKGYELHMTLWQLLNEIFKSSKDLMELVMQNDKDNNNFIHTFVTFNEKQAIELTFKFLDEKLDLDHFKKVFQSRGFKQRNVTQKAADKRNKVSVHQCLWTNLQNSKIC